MVSDLVLEFWSFGVSEFRRGRFFDLARGFFLDLGAAAISICHLWTYYNGDRYATRYIYFYLI